MTEAISLLRSPPPANGWTPSQGEIIARHLVAELGLKLELPSEIVHGVQRDDNRDSFQSYPDSLTFRVRTIRFAPTAPLSIGGIIAVNGHEGPRIDAILFLFVFGEPVESKSRGCVDPWFRYAIDADLNTGQWEPDHWRASDFHEEWEPYDFAYFAALLPYFAEGSAADTSSVIDRTQPLL